jgi:hypothetical protein
VLPEPFVHQVHPIWPYSEMDTVWVPTPPQIPEAAPGGVHCKAIIESFNVNSIILSEVQNLLEICLSLLPCPRPGAIALSRASLVSCTVRILARSPFMGSLKWQPRQLGVFMKKTLKTSVKSLNYIKRVLCSLCCALTRTHGRALWLVRC